MVLFAALVARADIIQFRLDGLTGDGLLSGNEGGLKNGGPGPGGIGSGGISLDTDTGILSIDVPWGSGNGFVDLTANATVMHVHGLTSPPPIGFGEGRPPIIDLDPLARIQPGCSERWIQWVHRDSDARHCGRTH